MANTSQEKLTILRRVQVEKRTGLSRSTIYLQMQKGKFPKQITLGLRSVGWLEHEIENWLLERIRRRDAGSKRVR